MQKIKFNEPRVEMPKDDFAENRDHDFVLKLGYRKSEEMSFESLTHVFAATHRRSHSAHELYVDQFNGNYFFPIVPLPVVEQLSQQFYRRLSAVRFLQRHRYIIDEDHPTFADRRSEYSLAPLVELARYYVLRLIRSCLSGEINEERLVDGRVIFLQKKINNVNGFSGSGWTHE